MCTKTLFSASSVSAYAPVSAPILIHNAVSGRTARRSPQAETISCGTSITDAIGIRPEPAPNCEMRNAADLPWPPETTQSGGSPTRIRSGLTEDPTSSFPIRTLKPRIGAEFYRSQSRVTRLTPSRAPTAGWSAGFVAVPGQAGAFGWALNEEMGHCSPGAVSTRRFTASRKCRCPCRNPVDSPKSSRLRLAVKRR